MGMVSNEMRRALGNPWFKGSMVVLIMLAVAAALFQVNTYVGHWQQVIAEYGNESYYYHTTFSCFNNWLPLRGANPAAGFFFVVLPLLVLMGYAWSLASDVRSGYVAQVLTRSTRGEFYKARYCSVFTSAGLLATIPLIVNLLIVACFLPAYMPRVTDAMYIDMGPTDLFANVFFSAPLLYVLLKLVVNFVLCGLWATMVMSLATVWANRVVLICVPYIALLLIKHVGENLFVAMRLNGYEHFGMSITLFDQLKGSPDNFYCYWWATLACAVLMLVVSIVVPYFRRKADVL